MKNLFKLFLFITVITYFTSCDSDDIEPSFEERTLNVDVSPLSSTLYEINNFTFPEGHKNGNYPVLDIELQTVTNSIYHPITFNIIEDDNEVNYNDFVLEMISNNNLFQLIDGDYVPVSVLRFNSISEINNLYYSNSLVGNDVLDFTISNNTNIVIGSVTNRLILHTRLRFNYILN